MNALQQALRSKYGTPEKALAALGLPADLLAADANPDAAGRPLPRERNPHMTPRTAKLSSTALRVHAALTAHLLPKLAADAKLNLLPAVSGVTRKNLKANAARVWARAKVQAKAAGVAMDALGPDDVAMRLLDIIDGQGAEVEDPAAAAAADPAAMIEEGAKPDAAPEPAPAGPVTEPSAAPAASAKPEPKKEGEPVEGEDDEDEDAEQHAEILRALAAELGGDEGLAKKCYDIMHAATGTDEISEAASVPAKTGEASLDGKAKDNKVDAPMTQVTKTAMDSAIKAASAQVREDMRAEARAANEARSFVRPWVGEVSLAFDTAQDIYKAALEHQGVSLKGVHPSAFRAILERLPRPGSKHLAHDAAIVHGKSKASSRAAALTGRIGFQG